MDLNAIKNRLNQLQATNTRTSNLWKPSPGQQIVRIVPYKFNKDNNRTEVGYKTYRSKEGATGKTNNTMTYSTDMQNCFKGKK